MIINEIMKKDVVYVSPGTKLNEAYILLQENNIRHLPVIENQKLVGIISDRDLRFVTSKLSENPFDPGSEIKNIMNHPVKTVHPSDPVETATQIMRENKIGCLPVVEENRLVGIVTNTDLLDALLLLTGVHHPSARLDVRLSNKSGELARLANLLAEHKVNIYSVLTYPDKDKKVRLVLRLGTIELKILSRVICDAGFEVIWPIQLSCAK